MGKPLVSVIMPVFNAEAYLAAAIESVLAQSLSNWELLLIDDASKDGSKAIAESYAKTDGRIRILHLDRNHGGPGFARNQGIRMAEGRYVAFLDSDDT